MSGRTMAPWARAVCKGAALLLVINLGGAHVLSQLGVIEALMASIVPLEMGLLPVALLLGLARLLCLVLAPGLVAAALLLGWRAR